MDFWGSLLGGFMDRKYDVERENRRQSDLAAERERAVFSTLLQSEDPETQQIALAGLLDSVNPRRKAKGLRGWIGETLESPHLQRIRALSPTVQVPEEYTQNIPSVSAERVGRMLPQTPPGGPQQAVQPTIAQPPPSPSAAMPASSPVQPGAPPPTPTGYQVEPPPTPVRLTRMAMRPRNVIPTPESTAYRKAIGEARAEVEGEKARVAAGLPPRYGAAALRSAGLGQSVSGEAPDETGTFQPTFGVFHRDLNAYLYPGTSTPIPGFRPRTTTASTSLGVAIEPLARAMFNKRGADLDQTQMAQVMEASKLQKGILTTKDAISAAQRFLPNATVDQQLELADALRSGTAAPVTAPQAPPATNAPSGGATSPPAPAVAPASAQTLPAGQGGPPKLSSVVPPSLAGGSKETGKPLPPAVARTLAQAKSTNDLIDQALAALEPFKADGTLEGALKMAQGYRLGSADDPIANAAAQLSDLAGLQNSAQSQLTGGGTRAFQFYIDRRQHVPRLPSGREVLAYKNLPLSGQTIQNLAITMGGQGFDSPKLMYDKLQQAKTNNLSFIRELEQSVTINPMPSHETTPSTTPRAYKDANGNWVIRQ